MFKRVDLVGFFCGSEGVIDVNFIKKDFYSVFRVFSVYFFLNVHSLYYYTKNAETNGVSFNYY